MESREPLAKPEEQLWSALAAVMHTVPQALESHMRSAVRMTTTEYRALGRLRWAGSGGLRVKALAEELGLSTSGAARIGEILVARGDAVRPTWPGDDRARPLVISETGLARFDVAEQVYVAASRRLVIDRLSSRGFDLDRLATALKSVLGENS
jgi:DNA-binding MarR family transcriptional regulator